MSHRRSLDSARRNDVQRVVELEAWCKSTLRIAATAGRPRGRDHAVPGQTVPGPTRASSVVRLHGEREFY